MRYEFSHNEYVRMLLPPRLRGVVHVAWVRALVAPLSSLYQRFLVARIRLLKEASYNSQEMLYEFVLNESYDSVQQRISIATNRQGRRQGAYLQSEGPKLDAYLQSEGPKTEGAQGSEQGGADFTVSAPLAVQASDSQFRGLIETYKLGGKVYEIIYN